MHILNLLIIPIILASLFGKIEFSYLVALTCSLAAATFIYRQQALANILFTIIIFNLTPVVCLYLNAIFKQRRLSLKADQEAARMFYQRMQKENSTIRETNLHLSEEVFRRSELYKMTRDMSALLDIQEVFNIFGRKLTELLPFKRCRLILTSDELGLFKIEQVWELRYLQAQASLTDLQRDDSELLKLSLRSQKLSRYQGFVTAPLNANNRFLGTLAVEDLPADKLDNFSTLANQFCLIFERAKLYEHIQSLAIHDGLTGLFVRRYFLQRLDEELNRSQRHNISLSFLIVDIDHFKQCNDTFGHLTGDAVLTEVAARIKASVRQIDLVGRYAGDEFMVLLPDTDSGGGAYVAERIRLSIERYPFQAYDETLKLGVSIGIASFPKDATLVQDLIDKADQALYRAKQEGKNRVSVYG